MARGVSANEAAAMALQQVREEHRGVELSATPDDAVADATAAHSSSSGAEMQASPLGTEGAGGVSHVDDLKKEVGALQAGRGELAARRLARLRSLKASLQNQNISPHK